MLPPSAGRSAAAEDELGRETLAAVEWSSEDREDNWLISYADLLSVIFTMVVLLFGRMTVVAQTPAVEQPTPETSEVAAAVVPEHAPVTAAVSPAIAASEPAARRAQSPRDHARAFAPPRSRGG